MINNAALIDVRLSSLLLDRSSGPGAVLWQLNYGSYGTFDFLFVVNLVVGLAVMIVGRTESDVNAAVAFVLLRIGSDDGAECGGDSWCWNRRDDLQRLMILVFIFLILMVTDRRQSWDRIVNDETGLIILVIFHVEHLNLLLLLLSMSLHNRLRLRKCLVVVLDNDLDDRLRCFRILMVVWRCATANEIARLVICLGVKSAFNRIAQRAVHSTYYILLADNCSHHSADLRRNYRSGSSFACRAHLLSL